MLRQQICDFFDWTNTLAIFGLEKCYKGRDYKVYMHKTEELVFPWKTQIYSL